MDEHEPGHPFNVYEEQRAGFSDTRQSQDVHSVYQDHPSKKVLSYEKGNLIEQATREHGVDPQVFRAFNQADSESCVAASIGYGLVLVALTNNDPGTLVFVKRHRDVPSVNYAYHKMRQLECKRTGQCACGPSCSDTCNADCGSLVSVGLEIYEEGVPPSFVWPEDNPDDKRLARLAKKDPRMGADHMFYLDTFHPIETSALDVLEALRKGQPVIINLRVWSNQKTFFTTGAPSYVRGYGFGGSVNAYHEAYRLPPGNGPTPENYGHCLLIYGYSLDHRAFLVRNSFGPSWGYMGDFSIGFDQVNPSQIFQTVVLTSASTK